MPRFAKKLLVACAVFCGACSRDTPGDQGPRLALQPFSGVLEPVDTVVLQPGASPIVRVSGIDVDARGRFVLADRSEAKVYLFDSHGALIRAFGGYGAGPGEFYSPHTPRFGPGGRIHVPDTRTGTISVFDSLGTYQRRFSTSELAVVSTLEVLPDGSYMIAGLRSVDTPELLFTMDSTGKVLQATGSLGDRRPAGARKSPAWAQIRRPSIARRGDSLTVVLSTSDSAWHFGPAGRSGEPVAEQLPIHGYTPPRLPRGRMDLKAAREWGRSFSTVADVLSTDSSIAVQVVRGVLYEGDSTTVLFRQPTGEWINLRNAPVLLRAGGGLYVGTPDPTADSLRLVLYRRKR